MLWRENDGLYSASSPRRRLNEIPKRLIRFLVQLCQQIKSRFELKADCLIAKTKVMYPVFAQESERSPPFISDIEVAFPLLKPEDRLDILDNQ